MKDENKTKKELIRELVELRRQAAELEKRDTGRGGTEDRLQEQLAFLQRLIDTIPSPIFFKDVDGRYLGCNEAFEKAIGFSRSELVGRSVYDVAPKELADKYYEMDAALFKKGGIQTYEHVIKYADGTRHDVIFNKATYASRDGRLAGLVGVMTDITDHKRAEGELRKLYRAIEQSPVAVVITDIKARIEYVNPKFTELTGYSPEEAVGQNPRLLKSGEHPLEFYRNLWDTITSGRVWRGQFHNKKKNGELYWEDATISPVTDEEGTITHYIAVKEDITERRRGEEEKERLQAQLFQSQKMEAVGTLAGGIAHDFNNIMTVVKTLSDLAMEKLGADDPLMKYLLPITDSARRATDLVQQLLIFSREEPVNPVALDLNDTVGELLGMFEHLISEDISIQTEFSHELSSVMADRGRIEQLIVNMVINSADAMARGGTVTLRTENVVLNEGQCSSVHCAVPGEYVCLTVQDTGTGMDEEAIKHCFEPFFTTKKTKGTGMGLAVVYSIVKEHKGCVDVWSKPGEGSRFKVYLPVCAKAKGVEAERPAPREKHWGGGKRILLVEDEKWVRRSTSMVLIENGYEVFEASNAENAIELFYREKGKFDLVLTDVVMPGRSGLQMVGPLLDINPDIPILLCSGYLDDKAQLSQIVKRGFAFIQKPYEISELLLAVEDSIDRGE